MARGPLPNKQKRRTNASAIPTTFLPKEGRKGRAPDVPVGHRLGKVGKEWWKWAWHTPQSTQWDEGARYVVARRAELQDDLAGLELRDEVEVTDLLDGASEEAIERIEFALSLLKKLAGNKMAIVKEMRELDKLLGLTPKSMSDLRWEVEGDEEDAQEDEPEAEKPKRKSKKAKEGDRRQRLSLVS